MLNLDQLSKMLPRCGLVTLSCSFARFVQLFDFIRAAGSARGHANPLSPNLVRNLLGFIV